MSTDTPETNAVPVHDVNEKPKSNRAAGKSKNTKVANPRAVGAVSRKTMTKEQRQRQAELRERIQRAEEERLRKIAEGTYESPSVEELLKQLPTTAPATHVWNQSEKKENPIVATETTTPNTPADPTLEMSAAVTVFRVPLHRMIPHPWNQRARQYSEANLEKLDRIITENPEAVDLHPLTLCYALDFATGRELTLREAYALNGMGEPPADADEPAYYITSGNHRSEVYRRKRFESAPAIIRHMTLQEQAAELVNANENRPISSLERGLFYLELESTFSHRGKGKTAREDGVSQARYAKQIGRSTGYVSECVRAAKVFRTLDEKLQSRIIEMNAEEELFTREHFKLLEDLDAEMRNFFADAVVDNGWSHRYLKLAIESWRSKMDPSTLASKALQQFGESLPTLVTPLAPTEAAAAVEPVAPEVASVGVSLRDRAAQQRQEVMFPASPQTTQPVDQREMAQQAIRETQDRQQREQVRGRTESVAETVQVAPAKEAEATPLDEKQQYKRWLATQPGSVRMMEEIINGLHAHVNAFESYMLHYLQTEHPELCEFYRQRALELTEAFSEHWKTMELNTVPQTGFLEESIAVTLPDGSETRGKYRP